MPVTIVSFVADSTFQSYVGAVRSLGAFHFRIWNTHRMRISGYWRKVTWIGNWGIYRAKLTENWDDNEQSADDLVRSVWKEHVLCVRPVPGKDVLDERTFAAAGLAEFTMSINAGHSRSPGWHRWHGKRTSAGVDCAIGRQVFAGDRLQPRLTHPTGLRPAPECGPARFAVGSAKWRSNNSGVSTNQFDFRCKSVGNGDHHRYPPQMRNAHGATPGHGDKLMPHETLLGRNHQPMVGR